MSASKYDPVGAKQAALDYLKRRLPDATDFDPIRAQALVRAELCGMDGAFFTADIPDEVERLAADAETDPVAWEAVLLILESLAGSGRSGPAALIQVALPVLRGDASPPSARRSYPGRDLAILEAIKIATEAGGTQFKARASDPEKTACGVSVVHEALADLGRTVTVGHVANLWKRSRKAHLAAERRAGRKADRP